LLGIEHLGPEVEQLGAVAVVEPDRELGRLGRGFLYGTYDGSLGVVGLGDSGGESDWLVAGSGARLPAKAKDDL
jgi:hypothetical protein